MTIGSEGATRLPMWRAVSVICGSQVMVAFTVTNVLVGGHQVGASVGLSTRDLHWLVTAYGLTFGGLVLLCGRLSDAFGPRRVFIGGQILFAVASAAVGLAQAPAQVVAGRAVQGVGAALIAPAAL